MQPSKSFLHDRIVLVMITAMAVLAVVGISLVLLRFDAGHNPTTVSEYRQSLSSSGYIAGRPLDIYLMAVFMLLISLLAVAVSAKAYTVRRFVAHFLLAGTNLLLIIAIIVSNALVNLQ